MSRSLANLTKKAYLPNGILIGSVVLRSAPACPTRTVGLDTHGRISMKPAIISFISLMSIPDRDRDHRESIMESITE